jgi:NAD(P)-dependent dehydrogenase (short-subunit alcohol dehydrogenase family)
MVILITGITSGFGRAMASRLQADGHKVYGTHRKDCGPIPGVTYIKADVRDPESVDATVKAVLDAEGRIDVFINNAGMGIGGPLEFTPFEDAQMQAAVKKFFIEKYKNYDLEKYVDMMYQVEPDK